MSPLRVFSPRNLVLAPQIGLKTLFVFTLKFLREIETEWGPVGLPSTEVFLSPVSCMQDFSLHELT